MSKDGLLVYELTELFERVSHSGYGDLKVYVGDKMVDSVRVIDGKKVVLELLDV